jgi:hypothetical protein
MKRMLLVALVLALLTTVCVAERADLQFEGSAGEAADVIGQQYGIQLHVSPPLAEKQVVLDLADASYRDALLALAHQVGAVYDWWGGDRRIHFREGDPTLDSRPSAPAASARAHPAARPNPDYIVSVTATSMARSSTVRFGWGEAQPGAREDERLSVRLVIEPVTVEAADRLRGVWPDCTATLDTGEVLVPPEPYREDPEQRLNMMGRHNGNTGQLVLELPDTDAEAITELSGKLALWQSVETETVSFARSEVEATRPIAGTQVTLDNWSRLGDEVRVSFSLPTGNSTGSDREFRGELVGPGGETAGFNGRRITSGPEGTRLTFSADYVDWEPERVEFTLTVREGSSQLIDFTIKDIPLP